MSKRYFVIFCAVACLSAATKRDWKTAVLRETMYSTEPGPVVSMTPDTRWAPAAPAMSTAMALDTTWQAFRLDDGTVQYVMACPLKRHRPAVTINGPIRFAVEKGKAYLLDDNGREFRVTVLEKRLLP